MKIPWRWLLSLALLFAFAMPVMGADLGPPDSGVVIEQAIVGIDVFTPDAEAVGQECPFCTLSGSLTSDTEFANDELKIKTGAVNIVPNMKWHPTARIAQPFSVKYAVVVNMTTHTLERSVAHSHCMLHQHPERA